MDNIKIHLEKLNKAIDAKLGKGKGDKVFTLFTIEGILDKGKVWDYFSTGKKVRYNAQYTARFENGLIVEMWATCDGHTILKQIGII